MWKQDLEAFLKAWPKDRLITKIIAVYHGIRIVDTEGVRWHYNYNEGTLTRLPHEEQKGVQNA